MTHLTVPSRKTEGHQRCGCGLVRWRVHDGEGHMWQFNTLRVLLRPLHYTSLHRASHLACVYCCGVSCHGVLTLSHGAPFVPHYATKCAAMFQGVPPYPMMSRDVPLCLLMSHDVPCCPILSHDVSLCLLMSHDVSLCLLMSRDVPFRLLMSHELPFIVSINYYYFVCHPTIPDESNQTFIRYNDIVLLPGRMHPEHKPTAV